ncbi:glycosyltransferase [Alteromonas macleodii]|uniref:glycosyltransferase n=1 Tax=Alteromonas TaxID=226 RepID=UPI000C3F6351|nr:MULTISPECIES: glycosyltransferase [Alteromonas]MBE91067.1 glycosyl transferase family 1 [Rhodospirillaceae bacterium]MCZ4240929.1 glycosyltransferase [Alteromonas macleodii]PXW71526.1 glycosyltransferase involved in cell wall biosynthesis [Alteromonas sp. I10]|tara:strand:- start:41562 stop:42791 length:1230 start_codon:yes stop_codon:yes gene_type:complete
MKILIVTSNYPRWPGDNTTPFVHNFARELVNQGVKVRVLAPHFEGAKRKDIMDDVEIRRFRYWLPESGQTVCYQGGALGNLKKNWVNKLKLPVLVACEFFFTLIQTLFWKPTWINSHWLIPQGFVCALVSKLTRAKHVATIHGGDVLALDGKTLRKFKSFSLKHSNVVTVNSSVTKAKAEELSPLSADNVILIPTGILPLPTLCNEQVSKLRAALLPENTKHLILFVGRVNEEKGVGELIDATKKLIDSGKSVHLAIVGSGHDECRFRELAENLDITESVTFVGWVNSKEIYNYYAAADVFAGPSKQSNDGWIEAQGLTFVEAMLAGCKVVGTNSGGIPDAVIHGKTGWLSEPGNADNLANALALALSDQGKSLTAEAFTFAKKNYLISNTVEKFRSKLHNFEFNHVNK